MKSALTLALCIMLTAQLRAQDFFYAGIGYNISFYQSEGLDFVIDRYNETRPYLTTTMPYARHFDGITMHIGGATNSFIYDFGYTQRACTVTALGVDISGEEVRRDVKSKWNTYDIGLGVSLGNSDKFAFMLGVNTGINSEKADSRSAVSDNIGVARYTTVVKKFKVGFEPFVQLLLTSDNGLGILFKPYYTWTPTETNYADLNAYINPFTYTADPLEINGKLTGYGLSIMLIGFGAN